MNVLSNAIEIAASPMTIYGFAAETPRWPDFLPHYRYVRVRERRGALLVVEMAARRDWIPIRWVAEQRNDPERPHIAFRHVAGATRGMEVEWRFEPLGDRTRVTIEHRLDFAFPFAADLVGRRIVGEFFIHDVATKTLARMKQLAEGGS